MRRLIFICCTLLLTLYAHAATSFAPAVRKALPSVVAISAEKVHHQNQVHPLLKDPFFRHFFEDNFKGPHEPVEPSTRKALGSGVIVSEDGYILTNYHVIREAQDIKVQLSDDRTYSAKLVGTDPDSDLAVLQIEARNLPVASIGQDHMLQIGDIVLAIGNPFGVGQTVTQGIVSAMKRKNLGLNIFESYIQTDAAINPGNSGGPLIDINGDVIGINTAIISRSGGNNGIGFAVPISFATQVMQELIQDGHVTRGWLGIYMAELNDEVKKSLKFAGEHGVLVTGIARSSPAAQSGLRPGDVIVNIDEQPIHSGQEVSDIILSLKPNSRIEIEVFRDGQEIVYGVIIGTRK